MLCIKKKQIMYFVMLVFVVLIMLMNVTEVSQERIAFAEQRELIGHLELSKVEKVNKLKSLGKFRISYYNGDGSMIEGGSNDCFGKPLKEGVIAVDSDVIPLNSKVIIGGKEYIARDVGGMINGNHIDMYIDDSSNTLNEMGIDYFEVYIVQ